jgi:enoyl-CoA hydratase
MTMAAHLALERVGRVAVVRIDRPEKHNALGPHFWTEMRCLLETLEREEEVRAVVLTGAGERAFSAGGDIAGFQHLTDVASRRAYMKDCLLTFEAIEESPLPVIAAVNGWALGGGCELAMACDIVMASERAVFGLPELQLGLVPGFGVLRGPATCGRQWTKYMVLGGARLTADEAYRAGLVQRVVPPQDLVPAALALATDIATRPAMAVAVGKRLVNRGVDRGELGYALEALTLLFSSEETAELIRQFIGSDER